MAKDEQKIVTPVSITNDRHFVSKEDKMTVGESEQKDSSPIHKQGEMEVGELKQEKPEAKSENKKSVQEESSPATEKDPADDSKKEEKKSIPSKDGTKPASDRQKTGCLLLVIVLTLFAVIGLIVLIQSSNSDIKGEENNPAAVQTTPEQTNPATAVEPAGDTQNVSTSETDVTSGVGGDSETAFKLIFGILGILSFLALILGLFMFFTGKTPENKARARKILLPAVVGFVLMAMANSVVIFYYAQKEPAATYTTSPIKVTYFSEWQTSAPLDVEFDVSQLPEIADARFISWSFGDGGQGTGAKVRHVFEKIGDFEVKATFTMNDGTEKTYTRHVPVNNVLPAIEVATSAIEGLAPLLVTFDASRTQDSNGSIIGYQWLFPNGVTATGPLAEHTFEQKGEYEVTLQVTDNNSETASETIKIIVTDQGKPTAVIETKPEPPQGQIPMRVQFAGGSSSDPDGNIVRYEWDFGDGSARENGQNAVHSYTKEGDYVAKLTVWDDDDFSGAAQVQVKALKQAVKPVAVIMLTKGTFTGTAPLEVSLDGGQSYDSDGNIVTYQWEFGDETPSATGQKVDHTFTEMGQYEVALTVTDDDGLSVVKKQSFKVKPTDPVPPVVLLTTDPDPAAIAVGEEVTFDASQSYDLDGNIISYEWDFGDKTVRLGPAKITHKYTKAGIYTVTLTAYDNSGKTTRAEAHVAVSEPNPIAQITASVQSGRVPLVVNFDAADSAGNVESYEWDFGDGLKSTQKSPKHIFTSPGEYTVKLKVVDGTGVVSEDLMLIEVSERQ